MNMISVRSSNDLILMPEYSVIAEGRVFCSGSRACQWNVATRAYFFVANTEHYVCSRSCVRLSVRYAEYIAVAAVVISSI